MNISRLKKSIEIFESKKWRYVKNIKNQNTLLDDILRKYYEIEKGIKNTDVVILETTSPSLEKASNNITNRIVNNIKDNKDKYKSIFHDYNSNFKDLSDSYLNKLQEKNEFIRKEIDKHIEKSPTYKSKSQIIKEIEKDMDIALRDDRMDDYYELESMLNNYIKR